MLLSDFLDGVPQKARARHLFGLSTCNGCHYGETENKNNHHISPREAANEAKISEFMSQSPWVLDGIMDDNADAIVMDEPRRRVCALYRARDSKVSLLPLMLNAPH